MNVRLNHTIVWCRDQQESAGFLTGLLGLAPPVPFGPFHVVALGNDVSLDFRTQRGEIATQHYAFLVEESEFDTIFGRIHERGLQYWADPTCQQPGQINHHFGGRGVYFQDPSGHLLEIITRPYGG